MKYNTHHACNTYKSLAENNLPSSHDYKISSKNNGLRPCIYGRITNLREDHPPMFIIKLKKTATKLSFYSIGYTPGHSTREHTVCP